ncbi:MAG: Cof-type HAD-IIB family hydrolase [Defluviitaleaceae bacterium]|nr:Cof-type HAD-IIB family hydrolase [Defluviitaleaceae bacterium]
MYKLIATDVDGTLANDFHNVDEDNIKAIQKAREYGIKVVLCSGRSPASLLGYEKKIGLDKPGNYGIGFNGAEVYETDTRNIIKTSSIPKEVGKKIVKIIRSLSDEIRIMFHPNTQSAIFDEELSEYFEKYSSGVEKIPVKRVLDEHITEDITSLYAIEERPLLEKLKAEVESKNLDSFEVFFALDNSLEFMPTNVNKATGIRALARHLGIEMHEIVTVGDNYNDIEMIKEAGLGVAVANAVPQIRNLAGFITRRNNNESALAEVVDMVIEENRKM